MSGGEHWTRDRVAAELGIEPDSVGVTLRRLGVEAVGRQRGRGGQSLYAADAVLAAKERRRGRGRPARDHQ